LALKMKRILTVILPLLVCGCASPSLVRQMEQRGITHHNTGKIVLTGSEADVGGNVKVEIEEQFIIQEIWDSIYQSRPHGLWYSSGYRRADFYADQNDKPAASLWINASDSSFLDGQSKSRFRCPKLHAFVMKLLQEEYDRKQKANHTSEGIRQPADGLPKPSM
jgi:hypothetical protein